MSGIKKKYLYFLIIVFLNSSLIIFSLNANVNEIKKQIHRWRPCFVKKKKEKKGEKSKFQKHSSLHLIEFFNSTMQISWNVIFTEERVSRSILGVCILRGLPVEMTLNHCIPQYNTPCLILFPECLFMIADWIGYRGKGHAALKRACGSDPSVSQAWLSLCLCTVY